MVKSVLNYFKKNKKGLLVPFLVVLGLYFAIPFLKRLFTKTTSGYSEMNEHEKKIYLVAQTIANALGVTKSWYQISFYTEDEEKVIKLLKENRFDFKLIELNYYKITKNVLMSDLQKYLSVSDFENLKDIL